jgi:flagellar biosynthetic protein FliR
MLLFSGIQIAGQIVSQMGGTQLADVINPSFDESVPVHSQILYYVTLAVFVLIGGHRQVMEALIDTFAWMPPGSAAISESVTATMTELLTQSFVLGIRAAAPSMTALLLATLLLALVSRTLPQLNIMMVGFGFNAITVAVMLAASLGAIAWLFQSQLEPTLELLVESLGG